MRSVSFGGHDLSTWTTAEAIVGAACALEAEAVPVLGRSGAMPVAVRLATREIRVRLWLDLADDADSDDLAALRREAATCFSLVDGAELKLPGEPSLTYRSVLCTDASAWSSLFEDGSCVLSFTAFDPVAYGSSCEVESATGEASATFMVGGTWRTWPAFEFVASAGGAVQVKDAGSGSFVRLERDFAGGEVVEIDCMHGRTWVDGEASDADVTLESDFFWLEPGLRTIESSGCSNFTTFFTERWI